MALGVRFIYDRRNKVTGDSVRVTRAAHEALVALWQGAIRAYIEAIIEADVIKVDTGMSKATLLPMARMVGMLARVRATIHPRRAAVRGVTDILGNYNPKQYKTMSLGERIGRDAYDIKYGTPRTPVLEFEFNIKAYQYWLHENGLGKGNKGAWRSLQIGRAAFRSYILDHMDDYINVKTILDSLLGRGSFKQTYRFKRGL